MKKWFKFFCLSFFSNRISKEGAKRGYTNLVLGLILALVFLWAGFVGGDMLPFGAHYNNSPDFSATARAVFANADHNKRVVAEMQNGVLKAKKFGGEYTEAVLVNSFENAEDRQNYSVNGYNIVIDTRPANTLAEVEAYCLSNDGKNLKISYQEYLTLSEVARLNFDFKLRYTGRALELDDALVEGYREYLMGASEEVRRSTERLASDLGEGKITKAEYNRAIYELYFTNYYPKIENYESNSKVPLLRNYYYHNYISNGGKNYLFIFDDYMAGSFQTKRGIDVSFYGFFSNLENGVLIDEGVSQEQANALVDGFIKKSFNEIISLNLYAYGMNMLSFMPFIALMPMVVTLLIYSILKLRGIESINSLGAMLKIVGSYVWFSGIIAAIFTLIIAFFVPRNMLNALPLLAFFITLVIRSVIFAVAESRWYMKKLEQQQVEQLEV